MEVLRFVFVTIFCFGFILFLLRVMIKGLRSGKITYKDSSSSCDRAKSPLGFWLLVFVFSIFVMLFIFAWLKGAVPIMEKLIS